MTPGRPPPPFLREYRSGRRSDCGTCIQRLAHVTEYPPEVYGPRLAEIPSHRGGGFTDAHTVPESSRDVSDPTSGPLTLTPGPVTGSLTSRLRVRDRAMV